ncbi:MAG: hypothetical protein FIA89_05910 [Geobacter sp.]|nr:hypothetical protein [Geobacter sp.]
MLLSEYQTQIICVIDHYARTNLITSSEIVLDARSPKIGVLKGSIEFIDGTQLFFTKYVDCRYRLEKLNYSYHCQDSDCTLIFRYDNAAHKPVLPHPNHKHETTGNIIAAEPPELAAILDEIMEQFVS